MLKFLRLGTAAVLSIPVIGSLMSVPAAASQAEANLSAIGMADETLNADTNQANIFPAALIASSFNTFNTSQEEDSGIGTLLGIAAVGGSGSGALWIASKGRPFQLPSVGRDNSPRSDQASPQLQRKLLKLLHNDRATASRLLAQIQLNHPHKPVNWAVEKAIYDLERDRWR